MKKRLASGILATLMLSSSAWGIDLYVDGTKLNPDVPPIAIDGRTMVPVRTIFEALGAEVFWDGTTQTVTATKGYKTVIIKLEDTTAYVDGAEKTLDVPAKAIDGRTLVPIRFVSEALDAKVDWIAETQTINISTSAPNTPSDDPGSDKTSNPVPEDVVDPKTEPTGIEPVEDEPVEPEENENTGYNRMNPAPLKTKQTMKVFGIDGTYNVDVTIRTAVRGEKALRAIHQYNKYVKDPDPGMEYMLIYVEARVYEVENLKKFYVSGIDFKLYDSTTDERSDEILDSYSVSPGFSKEFTEHGGTVDGNIILQVSKKDPAPKLVFNANYKGEGGLWFSLEGADKFE